MIVAETTGSNANVLYEVGYAHALEKVVLLVAQHEEGIPFNLKHRQHTIYDGDTHKLKQQLVPKLAQAIRSSTLGYLYSHLDPDHEIAVNVWFHGEGARIDSSGMSIPFEANIKLLRRIEERRLGHRFEINSDKGVLQSEDTELLRVDLADDRMTIRWLYSAFDPEFTPHRYTGVTELYIREGRPVHLRYCRLSDCFTHLIFNYFTYQSGCVFRSERAPIGIRNGTIRSS